MCPQFVEPINLIKEFWKSFNNSKIRKVYNFIKHKGKPQYEEVKVQKVMGLIISGENCPTDIRDVQMVINLKSSIQELLEFDENVLFPYINNLYIFLEAVVNPSPFVF